jgi:serine/threonine protein kinase
MAVGPLSDIYSLGCTLYYSVTGKVPFPGGDSRSKCRRHCEETPWHPRRIATELAEEFVDTIADMMEKDPARRIQSAAEVAERLEPWASAVTEMVDQPIDRQAWTPPPPPHEPSQIREIPELSDLAGSGGLSASGGDSASAMPSLPERWEPELTTDRPSLLLPIAIALAVVIPLSLLIGAIIGFIVRGQM